MSKKRKESQESTSPFGDPLTPVNRLSRDLAKAAGTLSDDEARFLVDSYYTMQDARIRADSQVRSMQKRETPEPHLVLSWLSDQNASLEDQIKRALARYVDAHPVGRWMLSVYGIGPVIAAGLLAHIDINKAPTVGHIWRFAGLDPTQQWKKGQKRPWNASLKVLCWKAGESFVKFHGADDCFYGHIWRRQKDIYIARNEAGKFTERAVQILKDRNFNKDTDAYKAYSIGKLPPAHIHAMARRYAVKLFLSHLHHKMYELVLHQTPPKPYPFEHLEGHHDYIPPPEAPRDAAE